MKKFLFVIGLLGLGLLVSPVKSASAQQAPLDDYSVVKEVSVAGKSYVDANTTQDSATGEVGATVVWKLTVSYTGENEPFDIAVQDIIPAEFELVSTSDDANYDANTGVWLAQSVSAGTPRSIEITTTAKQTGTFTNTAELGYWVNEENEGSYFVSGFEDGEGSNNADDAVVTISEKKPITVVLGETTTNTTVQSTLSKTGSTGTIIAILASLTIVAVAVKTFIYSRR